MSTLNDRESDAREDAIWADQHPEEIVCPSCGGDKVVQANYGLVNWDEPRWLRCADCDGSGQIDPDDYDLPYSETL